MIREYLMYMLKRVGASQCAGFFNMNVGFLSFKVKPT